MTVPSVRRLLIQAYLPLLVLGIAIVVSTIVLLQKNAVVAGELIDAVPPSELAQTRALVDEVAAGRVLSAGLTLVALALGLAAVLHAQRVISRRVGRIVEYAERLGAGETVEPLAQSARDVLGDLEQQLGHVAERLAESRAALRADAEQQHLHSQVQHALALADREDETLDIATRALERLAPGRPAELLIADASEAHLRSQASTRGVDGPLCPVRAPADCHAMRGGQALVFHDPEAIDACPRLRGRPHGDTGAACVPLVVLGRAVGVLHVTSPTGATFPPSMIDGIQSLANHVGARTTMLRALATSRLQALTDPLTGLGNRRQLHFDAPELVARSDRGTLVVADLDHFKKLNDTFGHDAGDRALRVFAQVLRKILRPSDLVARHGGEEFAIVLPECSPDDALVVLERIRATLSETVDRDDGPAFTVSMGCAGWPEHGAMLEELLSTADAALYEAKAEGRDRVVFAPAARAPTPG